MTQETNKVEENRWNKIILNILGYTIVLLITFGYLGFKDLKDRQLASEDKITYLIQDKVSRAEFREEINNMRFQIEGTKTDIIARLENSRSDQNSRQETMKSDILARIDLLSKVLIETDKRR